MVTFILNKVAIVEQSIFIISTPKTYLSYTVLLLRFALSIIKILTKEYRGEKYYYASLVENKRIDGKVVQTVKANLGAVTGEQIPYLKAAYAKKKPRLVYDED